MKASYATLIGLLLSASSFPALADDDAATYRALASEALRLSGRDDPDLAQLLGGDA